MRGSAIILAAALLALAIVPAAEAEAPAEVYFFDGDDCKAQVYIKAGTEIGSWRIPELPAWADCWADEDGNKVTGTSTFGAGAHTIIAYKGEPVPAEKQDRGAFPIGAVAGVAGAFLIVAGLGGLAWWFYRRQ